MLAKKNKAKSKWSVRSFDDYHEIWHKSLKTIELGCFPEKGYSYYRYFGLFYSGKKPKIKDVIARTKKKVDFSPDFCHFNDGSNIPITEKEFLEEIKNNYTPK